MPETKAQRSAAAEGAATRKRHAAEAKEHETVDRTTELSGEVLKSVESGSGLIEAVRKFVERVDQGSRPSVSVRPGERRSSTPRLRWPTDWSIRSTTSFESGGQCGQDADEVGNGK